MQVREDNELYPPIPFVFLQKGMTEEKATIESTHVPENNVHLETTAIADDGSPTCN